MKKHFRKEVSHCLECPNARMDQNLTRHDCTAGGGRRMICWDGDFEDEEGNESYPPIPNWCPLPDALPQPPAPDAAQPNNQQEQP